MNENDVLAIAREAVWVTIKVGGPVMLIALSVGLVISLFQALTQIQEMTLVFVPKIFAVFLSLLLLFPFMLASLSDFTRDLFDRIIMQG